MGDRCLCAPPLSQRRLCRRRLPTPGSCDDITWPITWEGDSYPHTVGALKRRITLRTAASDFGTMQIKVVAERGGLSQTRTQTLSWLGA